MSPLPRNRSAGYTCCSQYILDIRQPHVVISTLCKAFCNNLLLKLGKYVVDQILSGKQREDIVLAIHEELRSLATKVRSGQIDISKFVVTKGLNKVTLRVLFHKSIDINVWCIRIQKTILIAKVKLIFKLHCK